MKFLDINEWMKLSYESRSIYLDLKQPCHERGGRSTQHKGVLAHFLGTTIPSGRILLCHACNNSKCSNPFHLYWGTDYENAVLDKKKCGTFKNPWQHIVSKYGEEEALRIARKAINPSAGGKGNKGKTKSKEHKERISAAITEFHKKRAERRIST